MLKDSETAERIKRYMFAGRNFERADLRKKDLRNTNFTCANFRGADLSGANLSGAQLVNADMSRACLHNVNFEGADLSGADLTGSYCKGASFNKATLWHVVFKGAILKNATFYDADCVGMDICRAECLGARWDRARTDGMRNIDKAVFRWFMSPLGGKPTYDPYPEAIVLTESLLGNWSFQENSGMGQSGRGYLE